MLLDSPGVHSWIFKTQTGETAALYKWMDCFLLWISWNFKLFFCLAENSEILALFLPLKGWVFTSVSITSKLKCWVWHLICSTKGRAYRKDNFFYFFFFLSFIFLFWSKYKHFIKWFEGRDFKRFFISNLLAVWGWNICKCSLWC